jgi:hypothetical protein
MYTDPLVLPHADGNISCVRINQDSYTAEYSNRGALSATTVKIRHTTVAPKAGKPALDRHNVELSQRIYADGEEPEVFRRVYVVIEQEPGDMDVKLVDCLADWLIATANANTTKLLSWES